MKNRFALALIALLGISALSVKAEFVKPETAAKYARGILGMNETPVPEKDGSMRAAGRDGGAVTPDYYVFNNPDGGWVIIAADDRVNPVIGYSLDGSFSITDMPDNIQWWMEGVSNTINLIREQDLETTSLAKEVWNNIKAGVNQPAPGKKVLETAEWDQGDPYNQQCPIVLAENRRSATGCMATAMAIVARYHHWPEHGTGVIGGYYTKSLKTYIPAYSIDNHYYDWDKMPMNDGAGRYAKWTQKQIDEVSQLMHDCGVMTEMDYSYSYGSGTSEGLAVQAMKQNLSYSESAVLLSRSSYSLENWYSIIRNEIDEDRVVIYTGNGPVGGHAFVCDGYDTEGSMLRFNWGWGGSCNGFYTLDLDLTKRMKDVSFPDYQSAIIGLVPDTAKIEMPEKATIVCVENNGFYGLEPYSFDGMTEGSDVRFVIAWIMNNEESDVDLEFKICLEDKEGNVRQEGWNVSANLPAANGRITYYLTDPVALTVSPLLTDRFRLYVKIGDGIWQPMPGNKDILPDEDGVVCGVTQDPLIIVPDDCSAGQEITLSLSLGFSPVKSVSWSLNGTEIEGNKATLVQGKNVIRADVEYLDESTGSIFKTLQLE